MMGRLSHTVVAAAGAVLVVAGCANVLGVSDIDVDPTLGGPLFLDPDGSSTPQGGACQFARDCPEIPTAPEGCATASCVSGKCVYSAADKDQDGHRTSRCAASDGTPVEIGDDCDDGNAQLYPGHPADCAEDANGSPITFPNGQPVGACAFGKRSCKPDGTVSACEGAVGPKAVTSCTPNVDEACTGNPMEGCSCTAGQTVSCGTSTTGACKKGTSSCQANNTFGPCVGNVEPGPRDCGSGGDGDCNGTIDAQEVACQCTGGAAPGTKRACNTHPGYDGVGTCTAGSQTCTSMGSTSAWSACSGDVGPQMEGCDQYDRDCNGTKGVDDPAPPPPAGTMNCTKIYRCSAADRGPLYYRTNIGFTNYAGGGTLWTAYAPRGSFSAGTYPPGTYRISRDSTGTKMGPVSVASACCGASGCPTANILYDGAGQFYSPAP